MLELCSRPLGMCFSRGGGRDGLSWDVDLKPHAYGDFSMSVVQANASLEDQAQVLISRSATYIGVYDGHGGPEASRFIAGHLFSNIHKFALEQEGLSAEVIKRAFHATEDEFLHLAKRTMFARPQMASVGSCCLVGAISNDVLYVANLGDSRAVLGRRVPAGGISSSSVVVAERLSTDHNVGVEEVRKEVEALHPDDSQIVVYTRGSWRIKGIIQVSRSIGDIYLKKPELSRDPLFHMYATPVSLRRAVLSAEPTILVRKLKEDDLFVIFASDGLWEQISHEAAIDIVLKNPRVGIARRLVRAALQEVARKREMKYDDLRSIKKGIRRYFHDDITVIVVFLGQQQGSFHRFKDQKLADCTSVPADIFSLNSQEVNTNPRSFP